MQLFHLVSEPETCRRLRDEAPGRVSAYGGARRCGCHGGHGGGAQCVSDERGGHGGLGGAAVARGERVTKAHNYDVEQRSNSGSGAASRCRSWHDARWCRAKASMAMATTTLGAAGSTPAKATMSHVSCDGAARRQVKIRGEIVSHNLDSQDSWSRTVRPARRIAELVVSCICTCEVVMCSWPDLVREWRTIRTSLLLGC